MNILIAEDDRVSRIVLERSLKNWGHDVLLTEDGQAAWEVLSQDDSPKLAIVDWMMPKLDGPEVCRRVRELDRPQPTYIILLTAKNQTEDMVAGLDSGANDYMFKPFDRRELHSRVRVAERTIELQRNLADKVRELEQALAQVDQLQGMLPICCYCKKIRDDGNYWHQVETYIERNANVQFSHGVCPDCYADVVKEFELTATV